MESFNFIGDEYGFENDIYYRISYKNGNKIKSYMDGDFFYSEWGDKYKAKGFFGDSVEFKNYIQLDDFIYEVIESIRRLYFDIMSPDKLAYKSQKNDLYYDGIQCYVTNFREGKLVVEVDGYKYEIYMKTSEEYNFKKGKYDIFLKLAEYMDFENVEYFVNIGEIGYDNEKIMKMTSIYNQVRMGDLGDDNIRVLYIGDIIKFIIDINFDMVITHNNELCVIDNDVLFSVEKMDIINKNLIYENELRLLVNDIDGELINDIKIFDEVKNKGDEFIGDILLDFYNNDKKITQLDYFSKLFLWKLMNVFLHDYMKNTFNKIINFYEMDFGKKSNYMDKCGKMWMIANLKGNNIMKNKYQKYFEEVNKIKFNMGFNKIKNDNDLLDFLKKQIIFEYCLLFFVPKSQNVDFIKTYNDMVNGLIILDDDITIIKYFVEYLVSNESEIKNDVIYLSGDQIADIKNFLNYNVNYEIIIKNIYGYVFSVFDDKFKYSISGIVCEFLYTYMENYIGKLIDKQYSAILDNLEIMVDGYGSKSVVDIYKFAFITGNKKLETYIEYIILYNNLSLDKKRVGNKITKEEITFVKNGVVDTDRLFAALYIDIFLIYLNNSVIAGYIPDMGKTFLKNLFKNAYNTGTLKFFRILFDKFQKYLGYKIDIYEDVDGEFASIVKLYVKIVGEYIVINGDKKDLNEYEVRKTNTKIGGIVNFISFSMIKTISNYFYNLVKKAK